MGNSVRLHGQAISVDINGVRQEMTQFCNTIMKYESDFIYNCSKVLYHDHPRRFEPNGRAGATISGGRTRARRGVQ